MTRSRIVELVIVALLALAFLWFVFIRPGQWRDEAARAKADAAVANGAAEMSVTSGETYANEVRNEAQADAQTRKNAEAINAAPGAKVAVDPGVDLAGRRALCVRRAYVDSPACVELRRLHP